MNYFTDLTHSTFLGKLLNSFVATLFDGSLAVQLFWFMSGYVISIKLFGKDGKEYLKVAFAKRYFRLMIPVLGSILIAYLLMKLGWMHNDELAKVAGAKYKAWAGDFYNFEPDLLTAIRSGVWDTFFNYTPVGSYNTALWTMEPELLGSFFCFILFAVFKRIPYRYLVYAALTIAALLLGYYWLATFILGFLLCDIDHTTNALKSTSAYLEKYFFSKWYCCAVVLLLLIILNGFGQYYYNSYVKIMVSAGLIFTIMHSKYLRDLFSKKFLVWLGKISFALYLVHQSIICSFGCYIYLAVGYNTTAGILIFLFATTALVLLVAVLFTKWVDGPAIRFSSMIGKWVNHRSH